MAANAGQEHAQRGPVCHQKPEISVLLNTRSAMVVDLETQDMETTMHDLIVAGAYLVLAIHYFVMVIATRS